MNRDFEMDHGLTEGSEEWRANPLKRAVYFVVGSTSVALGVIGIFVPLWPTTCFLLLAGWCFARSSRRAERWLHENRLFGRYLKDYREHGVVSSGVRATSLTVLWAFIGLSALLLVRQPLVLVLLLLVAAGVTYHLYSLPTARPTLEDHERGAAGPGPGVPDAS